MNDRILLDVEMKPAIGSRFQPTGFPDLGAADFRLPNGTTALLVESAQSMANRLEGVAWDDATNSPVELLAGLPYVRVVNSEGGYVTSSRTESHRLASAFIKDSHLDGTNMIDELGARMALRQDTPLDHRAIAASLFRIDPMVLIHGVFFAHNKWPGQPKIARALTGFVEAHNVQRAESGGVKRDHVRHSIDEGSGGSSEGYGSVPFSRTEWTAERIVASFSIDLAQIRSYGLSESATALLADIAQWQVRSLVTGGLRLRTACDLVAVGGSGGALIAHDEAPIPTIEELETRITAGIAASASDLEGASILDVTWDGGKKK